MGVINNIQGKIFGRLTVVQFHELRKNRAYWFCKCDCGNIAIVSGNKLLVGRTLSCGCYGKEVLIKSVTTHGLSDKIPEYRCWNGIKDRCYNINSESYNYYGGRGITVCDRWINSFENFLEDMGRKPSKLHSIDRIDNDGNYEISNCKWSTKSEQVRNRRKTIMVSYNNKKHPLVSICEQLGFNYNTVCSRVYKKQMNHQQSFNFTYTQSPLYHCIDR